MKTQKPASIVMMMALCLMMAACGSSKSSSGGAGPVTTTTLPVTGTPPLPPANESDAAAAERERTDKDEQDNSGSTTVINSPTQQEIETMQKYATQFSGSSEDGIRDLLVSRIDNETDQVQRAKNLKFANSIITAELKTTPKASKIQLVLKIVDRSKDQKIGSKSLTYSGSLRSQKKSNRIDLQGKDKSGKSIEKLNGFIHCLDETRPRMLECQTMVAQVYLDKAMVQIILRKANAYVHGDFYNGQCKTDECEKVYGLLRNTQDGVKDGNSILNSTMETFEVIQGRSAFKVLITSREGEILKFEGPLDDPEMFNSSMDTALNRKLTQNEMLDPVSKKPLKTKMNQSLGDVRIQNNDGKGTLKIKVRMPLIEKHDSISRDEFDLVFTRELRPLRALLDERSKQSSLK
jgi:hypothetical protein